MLETIRAQQQSKDLHEQFHQQLERAPDGFSVIADYFGRGVFSKVNDVLPGYIDRLQVYIVSSMSDAWLARHHCLCPTYSQLQSS